MRFQFPASALTLRTLATKYSGCARHLFLAPMKRRSGVSTPETVPKMRLASQQSPANPSVTLFKLEPDGDPADSEPGPSASSRRSKRVKVEEVVKVAKVVDGDFPVSATNLKAADKGKKARTSRTRSTSPQKPKAIKQALEKPHPAPERWRETYDSIKEMRSRFPAPVDTMGCDTAKWKEMDPRARHISFFLIFLGSDLR